MKRPLLALLVLLNAILLLGQIWPEGGPPFARYVNIIVLILNLVVFISLWNKSRSA